MWKTQYWWFITIYCIKIIKINKSLLIKIPLCLNIKIFKKNNYIKIIMYDDIKIIQSSFKFKNNLIFFDKETNNMNINNSRLDFLKKIFNKLNEFYHSLNFYFFKKIKFKGKGFRLKIKKSKKICKFLFGHSHVIYIFLKNIFLVKCGKYKLILKNVNKNKLNAITNIVKNIKKNNIFTNRGIRESREILLKRKIKKTSMK